MLKLIKPSIKYEAKIRSVRKKLFINNESFDGCGSLYKYENIKEWIKHCRKMEHENTCPSYLVPSSLYMCIDSETKDVVGMIDIRHYLNENLLETGGNIGYTIAIDHRNKGYGKIQLQLAIDKIKKEIYKKIDPKKLSITTKILITCNENNIASKKIIIANGGVLENKVLKNGEVIERYWINLK